MVQRHLEQRIKDATNRDEDRPAIGAPRKRNAQRKCQKQLRERRLHPLDDKRAIFIGRSIRIKHAPNKKGKGKGRPRSPSPTGSPHRNSESDGKGSDDGRAKGAPTFISKSPSGKANRLPCTNIKNLGLGIVKL